MNTKEAWDSGRPIFSRMPEIYKENYIADNLLIYWETLLISLKTKIDDLPRQLDPNTCDSNWLDFLAPICGFTGDYWDNNWSDDSKRLLLANSYNFIWANKGSRQVLSFVLNSLNINHRIETGDNWIVGVSQLGIDKLGNNAWDYQILLPKYYRLNGSEFILTDKINKLYGPLYCKSQIIYDYI